MNDAPRGVGLRLLEGMFGSEVRRHGCTVEKPVVRLAEFQAEGAARIREVLQRRGGAILADSVGLGKTHVALAMIEETFASGGDAVVVAPAAIRGLWRRALRPLGGRWRVVSHTQLARGAAVRAPPEGPRAGSGGVGARLLVVDEAHRFRNPRTLRYAALARLIVPGTRVLLITATPVNNRPDDLLHLIRLFAADDAFRDVGVPSLRDAFDRVEPGSSPVASVVRAVVVRRTRTLLRERFRDGAGAAAAGHPRFPERAAPEVVRYRYPGLPRLVATLSRLELAPYSMPGGGSSAATTALIRLNLLKRMDSSAAGFRVSLDRLDRFLGLSIEAARAGRVVTPRLGRGTGGSGDGDPLQLALIDLVSGPATPDIDLPALRRSLERDLERVRDLAGRIGPSISRPGSATDPKILALRALLDRTRGEKVLVFTEYRDTAESVWRGLKDHFRVGRVDGSGAWLGGHPAGRRVVVERFAPRANGRRPPPGRERVDVMVATDVLAEGLNLQDARHVVSYELPWNPVRLLQRIGRVDRLGSPHAVVVPYLFAPDQDLEAMLGLARRIRTKLGHIATTVGSDQAEDLIERLVTPGVARRCSGKGHGPGDIEGALDAADAAIGRDESFEALRTLWIRNRPDPARRPRGAPPLQAGGARAGRRAGRPVGRPAGTGQGALHGRIAVDSASPAAGIGWVVLVRQAGRAARLLEIERDGTVREAGGGAVAAISVALSNRSAPATALPAAAPAGGRLPRAAIEEYIARDATLANTLTSLSPNDPGLRLTRRLRRTLGRMGAGVDPRLVARAGALLPRLAAPLDPIREARLRALLDRRELPLAALVDGAEAAVGGIPVEPGHVKAEPGAVTLAAALRIDDAGPAPATRGVETGSGGEPDLGATDRRRDR